ncbi:MAG: hypothetical protein ACK4K7_11940 [Allosphingosinicella sp.]|uniref:hypothetical protein n=1 Tax=Allosphingosinicella sp. TaxID=2823234 RepID=UPI0039595412
MTITGEGEPLPRIRLPVTVMVPVPGSVRVVCGAGRRGAGAMLDQEVVARQRCPHRLDEREPAPERPGPEARDRVGVEHDLPASGTRDRPQRLRKILFRQVVVRHGFRLRGRGRGDRDRRYGRACEAGRANGIPEHVPFPSLPADRRSWGD